MVANDHVDAGGHHRGGVDQRADGRRAFHRVRQPRVERELGRLAHGPDQQAHGDRKGGCGIERVRLGKDLGVVQRPEAGEHEEDRDQEARVADAVHHEGLGGRLGRRHPVVVVADEQIRAEPHPLPPDEEHGVVVAHHQEEHRDHEEVHVGKEAREPFLAVHVADRIDVDQKAHAGDHQHHDAGQRIDQEPQVDRDVTAEEPAVRDHGARLGMAERLPKDPERAEERQEDRAPAQSMGNLMRVAMPQHDVEPVGHHREERKERDEDDDQIVH